MRAKYYPGLFAGFERKGSGWIKALPPEDLQVFIRIGFECSNYGIDGGNALVDQYGKEHMSKIGRIGAIVTNSKKFWNRLLQEELYKLGL